MSRGDKYMLEELDDIIKNLIQHLYCLLAPAFLEDI